jgi:hypothetical protein
MHKLWDSAGYTYNMKVHMVMAKQHVTQDMTSTHAAVTEHSREVGCICSTAESASLKPPTEI